MSHDNPQPVLLILNQMAGPMTWELAEDAGNVLGCVALFTGHPDTLQKSHDRVLLYPAAHYQRGNLFRRTLSWVYYWLQAFTWLWGWPKEIPLLLFSNPPILCWLGWLMRRLRGIHYSVMVHDIYPDVLVQMSSFSEKHLLIRLWRWLNRQAYEQADLVMTLGEHMAVALEHQFDSTQTKHGKVEVIFPWVDTEQIIPIPKYENWFAQKHDQIGKLTVMYSGNLGLGHDIETILEAAIKLRNKPNIHFMFIGAGPKWELVQNTIVLNRLNNVTLLPWQPEKQLRYQLAAADVGLVSLEPDLWNLAIPSKALYMMAAGSAIVALAPIPSDLEQIVEKCSAGVTIPVDDTRHDALCQQLDSVFTDRSLLNTMKSSARQGANVYCSRRENSRHFLALVSGRDDL